MSVIKDFQTKYGLVSDGLIGKNTLLKIKEVLNIQTIEMLAHFMGQCDVESCGFSSVMENLNYSSEQLLKTFPAHFTPDTAIQYQRNPEMIANHVYCNRMGNGNEDSGDGWLHRGFGLIQLTGKLNQNAFANYIKDPSIKTNPSIIATKYAFESAKWFFSNNNLWNICNTVDTNSITLLSKKINGGTNGLSDRISRTNHYYSLLT
jgi:putative chitinase